MRSILDDVQQKKRPKGGVVRQAIIAHLQELLSTPIRSARAFMDLGVDDVNNVYCEYPDELLTLQREILATIATYEPRLNNVRIMMAPVEDHDLQLGLHLSASFVDEDGHHVSTSFQALVHNDNDVRFR